MDLEEIHSLHINLTNHMNLLEYLAYEMDNGREDVKLFAHILVMSGSYLEKHAASIEKYLHGEWEKLAENRRKTMEVNNEL